MKNADPSLRVVILGAASGIAEATARLYAKEGAWLLLVGRRRDRLESIAADLRLRGAGKVAVAELELASVTDFHRELVNLGALLGGIDHVLLAYGVLGEQSAAERDWSAATEIINVNFVSAAGWVLAASNFFEAQGHGCLAVLGSVAGDRGRRANFIYGAAKAGIATLVEGVAHRFADHGPRAVLIKVGPTDTPMTAGMAKDGPLWATPDKIAVIVRRSMSRGGPVVYAPSFWRLIMLVIRNLPTGIFNKMNI